LIDPSTNKPTRVGVRYLPDGSKERFAKKSGTTLSKIAPAKAKYAKK
jgi:large subunit ribosomal protein L24